MVASFSLTKSSLVRTTHLILDGVYRRDITTAPACAVYDRTNDDAAVLRPAGRVVLGATGLSSP